ncbi:MAG: DinB family protein [bacterium]
MNEETLFRMIDDFARFPGALLGIFQGTDLEMLRTRPAPERWSPLEILAHLRDEEKEDFRERARCAVEGRPIDKGIDPVGWVTSRQYNEMDPGAVFLDWSSERADSCRWLSTLTLEDLEKTVDHPRGGTMKAGDFITAWRVHDLLHLRQFATTMAQLWAARLAGYRADYAGDIPPA